MAKENENINNISDKGYPESAVDNTAIRGIRPPRDIIDPNNPPIMGAVYAGPEEFNSMRRPPIPMMMVYAGPDTINTLAAQQGLTVMNIGAPEELLKTRKNAMATDANNTSEAAPEITADSVICPTCGAVVKAVGKFCWDCGSLLDNNN